MIELRLIEVKSGGFNDKCVKLCGNTETASELIDSEKEDDDYKKPIENNTVGSTKEEEREDLEEQVVSLMVWLYLHTVGSMEKEEGEVFEEQENG